MANERNVCRSILDTKDVVKTQLHTLLTTALVLSGPLSEAECQSLCAQVNKVVDDQTSSLIDRVSNEFRG